MKNFMTALILLFTTTLYAEQVQRQIQMDPRFPMNNRIANSNELEIFCRAIQSQFSGSNEIFVTKCSRTDGVVKLLDNNEATIISYVGMGQKHGNYWVLECEVTYSLMTGDITSNPKCSYLNH